MVRHGPRFGGRALSGIGPLAAYADAPPRHRIGVCLWRQPEPQTILWLSGSFQRTPDQYQNDPKRHVPFLAEGNLIRGPRRLRTDWNRLGMFMNCVRFVEALGVPQDGAAGVFLLLKDTLELLEQSETVQDILPILFRLRLASQQGYAPALTACVSCGKKDFDHAGFLVSEGTIVCPDCVSGRGNIVEISGKSLDVLRQVQEVSPLHWHFLTSGSSEEAGEVLLPAERRECARAVDGFVQYHLGLTWDRGRFRRM